MRMRVLLLVLAVLVGLAGLFALAALGGQGRSAEVEGLIAQAEALYDRWSAGEEFDFTAYEENLRRAIALWEEALPLIPADQVQTKAHVLNRLSQAYFELAEGYLTKDERETAYGKGKDYALESLRLEPEFLKTEAEEGFRAALRAATDVAAIFWYGNNLGKWLDYHFAAALTGGVGDVKAAFERSVELDEGYLAGGPHRALAAFLAQVPGFLGGGRDEAKPHFERSIQLGPDYLENYVNYADYYAKPERDWELFCSLLKTALDKAQDPVVMAKWPFYNTLAVERARALWNYRYRGERVCGR